MRETNNAFRWIAHLSKLTPVALLSIASIAPPVWAAEADHQFPTDPIPKFVELPDPCDNPTTRRWGPDDELGNLNFLTPERVKENLGLIRHGKVYELSHPMEPGQMGFFASLDYKSSLGGWPGSGVNGAIYNSEETLGNSTFNPNAAGISHFDIGTQLDGFNHTTQNGITYNCFDTRDPANHILAEGDAGDLPKGNPGADYIFRGHTKHGIQNVGTIVARAVLIDVGQLLRDEERAADRDPDLFPPPDYIFSPEQLERALIRQGLTIDDIHPGDAILIRTGWAARYWTSNPADPRNERLKYLNRGQDTFGPGAPGLGVRAIQWTINRNPVLVGADNKCIEICNLSGPSNQPPFDVYSSPGHVSWLNSGIYIVEDLDMEVLAADCERERKKGRNRPAGNSCYIFTLMVQTIPIVGSGGSTVAPVAIR